MYGTEKVLPEPSRETKFSGVHKNNCAARDLGARTRASQSRTVLKKKNAGAKRDPREPARAPRFARAKIKIKIKIMSNRMLAQIKE